MARARLENISMDRSHIELINGINEAEILAGLPRYFHLCLKEIRPPAKITFTKLTPFRTTITAFTSSMYKKPD